MSPSAAGGKSEQWFEAFFDACESLGCRIDYLATHDYNGEADKVMNRLEDLYNRPVSNLSSSVTTFVFMKMNLHSKIGMVRRFG